jgi:hypothetical protein
MKRIILLFLCCLLFLTGCIEITDEITVNADGSGTIRASIDMGMLGSASDKQRPNVDMDMLNKIKTFPLLADSLLKGMPGISNLIPVTDHKKGLFALSMDFKDSRSLNKAIYRLFGKNMGLFSPSFVKVSKHKLVKKNMAPLLKKMLEGNKTINSMAGDMMMQFISFNSIYHLPAGATKISNIKAIAESGGTTVTTRFSLSEMIKTDFDYGIKIRY